MEETEAEKGRGQMDIQRETPGLEHGPDHVPVHGLKCLLVHQSLPLLYPQISETDTLCAYCMLTHWVLFIC